MTDLLLEKLSRSVTHEQDLMAIGLHLGIPWKQIATIINDSQGRINWAALRTFQQWNTTMGDKHVAFVKLCRALKALNRNEDLVMISHFSSQC